MTTDVEMFDEAADIQRLNDLLDQLTAKRFSTAALAAATLRAALDLYGIKLPLLDIEGLHQNSMCDGRAIQLGATSPAAEISAPPIEGEYFFNIASGTESEDDNQNDLYVYFIVSKEEDQFFDVYAQVVTYEEMMDLQDDSNFNEKDYPELQGAPDGETPYIEVQRHIGFDEGEA